MQGSGRGQFKVLSRHCHVDTEEHHEKTSVRIACLRAEISTRTFEIRSRRANHSTAALGDKKENNVGSARTSICTAVRSVYSILFYYNHQIAYNNISRPSNLVRFGPF
jgi:hypothetical protein